MPHIWRSFLAIILMMVGISAIAFADPSDLLINITTDGVVYQSGDVVNVQVETFFQGELTKAKITKAILIIELHDGKKIKKDIKDDFKMVSPGVFVASGKVKAPGKRTLDISAEVVKHVTCKCKKKVISNYGWASYDVQAIPLSVSIGVDNPTPTICDKVKVKISVSHKADIQVVAIFPNGGHKNLVIPSWVEAGEHHIEVTFDDLDIGNVILKVNAYGHYGQNAMATIPITVGFGDCDCPEDHHGH